MNIKTHEAFILTMQLLKVDAFLLPCPFKYISGIDCPGCGFQRSFLALLSGDFTKSFSLYPPTLFFIISFLGWISTVLFKYNLNAHWLKSVYFVTGVVVLINYIYKIATHQLH